jgi:hypothetical protein
MRTCWTTDGVDYQVREDHSKGSEAVSSIAAVHFDVNDGCGEVLVGE